MSEPVRGIGYDAGVIYEKSFDSNPGFTEEHARRDFQAIRAELGCDAVLIMASHAERLDVAARLAAEEGLAVWLQPRPFDRPIGELREAVRAAAASAERLRAEGATSGLVVGCELTLSASGLLPGPTFWTRGMLLPVTFPLIPLANRRLRRLLGELVGDARERFGGPISYGAGEWERPDWSIFDVVGADRYRDARNAWRFEDDIHAIVEGAHAHGKPAYIFEFGSCTYRGAADKASMAAGVLGGRTELVVPRRLVRDEQEQADYLTELLDTFDRAGVDGTFVWGFSEPALTTSREPGRDLDLASYGIVAAHADGTWTPKRAYRAIAERYGGSTP
ncbi:hypothetical protein GCM10011490_00860 [Pseudoclavibacter endophyticus]|uniref:Abortive infection protein n=1 Tax=Pseudoclavibacter endophyticus TaxID=1778590 RepID=A0A6H9WME7_9MICO|nr:hypothetical protein [Pseudoclavibacter endophyticus]KAB1650353.1 hypothetical protein F8O04_09275 [Pseudoclavibacter endophyticus]GGA54883.1 hypothetical protein GCM10011490_00860 [Pseudoclavibacter endophyticus]